MALKQMGIVHKQASKNRMHKSGAKAYLSRLLFLFDRVERLKVRANFKTAIFSHRDEIRNQSDAILLHAQQTKLAKFGIKGYNWESFFNEDCKFLLITE
jgi:hypothetical protein